MISKRTARFALVLAMALSWSCSQASDGNSESPKAENAVAYDGYSECQRRQPGSHCVSEYIVHVSDNDGHVEQLGIESTSMEGGGTFSTIPRSVRFTLKNRSASEIVARYTIRVVFHPEGQASDVSPGYDALDASVQLQPLESRQHVVQVPDNITETPHVEVRARTLSYIPLGSGR